MTLVDASSRLHFGLLSLPVAGEERWPDGMPLRRFGGVGLMLDAPRVRVQVVTAESWSAAGPSSDRALGFARAFTQTLPEDRRQPCSITVDECPSEHTGLGVGTALALATARAVALETSAGLGSWSAAELARRVGRGERSAVGVHGFELGGLIVEAGKLPGEALAPLIGRFDFPDDWRILLIRPENATLWHGARERRAFSRLTRNNATEALCRIVLTGMLPALALRDLAAFGAALHEFNVRAGEGFAAEQGGAWAGPEVAKTITFLKNEGIRGAGQSSWGPTVFALVGDTDAAMRLKERLVERSGFSAEAITISRAVNRGVVEKQGVL